MSFDRSQIDVEHLLEVLGVDNLSQEGATEYRFSCPFPNHAFGDRTPSAYMNAETTAFMCHSCKEKGDAVYLTSRILDVSPLEAVRLLREAYQPGYINPDARNTVSEVKRILSAPDVSPVNPPLPEALIERFVWDWTEPTTQRDYMLSRGFGIETLKAWGFGYDPVSDRIVFPVRNEIGQLVGFKGRSYNDKKPKYLIIGDREGDRQYGFPTHQKNQVVFGLDKAIPIGKNFVVCEGELNAIALWQAGYAAVAINGSYFGEAQARLLTEWAGSLTLFFDSDQAGNRCTWGWYDNRNEFHPGVVQRLKHFLPMKIVADHESDPADMSKEVIDELIENATGLTALSVLRSMQAAHT